MRRSRSESGVCPPFAVGRPSRNGKQHCRICEEQIHLVCQEGAVVLCPKCQVEVYQALQKAGLRAAVLSPQEAERQVLAIRTKRESVRTFTLASESSL